MRRAAAAFDATLFAAVSVAKANSAVPPLSFLMCARHRRGLARRMREGNAAFQMRGHEVGERLPPEKMCSPATIRRGARRYASVLAKTKPQRGPTRHVAPVFPPRCSCGGKTGAAVRGG